MPCHNNEGETDGYASEIKDHLPDTLEFVDGEFNDQYGWVASEDGRTLTTTYLKDSKIAKAEKNEDGTYVLTYKEVPVMCKVKDTAPTSTNLVNLADITVYEDENKKPVTDRDSIKDNVKTPEEGKWPEYNDDKTGEYIPGQEDDDDFDRVIIKEFDLALRKWVTQAIVTDSKGTTVTNTGHKPYDDPEQVVKVELHRKKINEVTVKFRYSIRIINEGEIAGYAKEITDYVPEGLKFVAEDNSGWTDEGNNVISTRLLENKLLQPGEYADVEVVLTWINNKDNMGVKTNIAEISEDYNEYDVPDKDSTPDNQKPGGKTWNLSKWFVPSKAEWAAFGDMAYSKMKVTEENYNDYKLNDRYWSSAQNYKYCAYGAGFGIGNIYYGIVVNSNYVRLSTTF